LLRRNLKVEDLVVSAKSCLLLFRKEIERKRLLVSKFKEDAINHIEIQELMAILKKEKHIAEEQ
jgi:hypothetical protein